MPPYVEIREANLGKTGTFNALKKDAYLLASDRKQFKVKTII